MIFDVLILLTAKQKQMLWLMSVFKSNDMGPVGYDYHTYSQMGTMLEYLPTKLGHKNEVM
jgi:hypothetical protein